MKDTTNILIALIALVSAATVRAASPDAKQIVSMQAGNFTLPDTIEMVKIPAGTFIMGSPKDELGRGEDETQRTVTISKPFYMAKTEIKEKQYLPIIRPSFKPLFPQFGYTLPELHQNAPWDPPKGAGRGSQAMDAVQWIQAVEFCRNLTTREEAAGRLPKGYEYRLPTEAEWEYVARAGTTTSWSIPEDANLQDYAWYDSNNTSSYGTGPKQVKTRLPNAFGLYDVHGNLREWVQDYASADYSADANGVTDPQGPLEGEYRVTRGGDRKSVV